MRNSLGGIVYAGRTTWVADGNYLNAMPTKLTDTDEGKDTVSSTDERIGIAKDVDDGAALIDPNPAIADELKAKLGWGDSDEGTYRLSGERRRDGD